MIFNIILQDIRYLDFTYKQSCCRRQSMKGICVFGDSVAKGVVFDEARQKYIHLKDNFISLTQKKLNIPFANYSVFGATVSKGEQIMKRRASSLGSFDYTILEFGGNDCDLNWKAIADTPWELHSAKTPLDQFENRYREMISDARSRGLKPILLTLPPLDPARFFNWVSKDLNRESILRYIEGDINNIYKWHKEYNKIILRLASEENLPVIDIRSAIESQDNYSQYLCIDGMHPNEKGHQFIADYLTGSLRNMKLA